jgi:hypothetical protein
MEKKIYENKREKVIDFLIGFLAIPWGISLLMFLIGSMISRFNKTNYGPIYSILYIVVFLLELIFAIYIGRKRKYIGIGLLFALVIVPLVLLGTCLLIMSGTSIVGLFYRR